MRYILILCLIIFGANTYSQTIIGTETFESETVGDFEKEDWNVEYFHSSVTAETEIVDVSGDKKLRIHYPTGEGQGTGYFYDISVNLFGGIEKEVYLQFHVDYSDNWTTGTGEFKVPIGFSGGEWVAVNDPPDTAWNGFYNQILMNNSGTPYFQTYIYDITRGDLFPLYEDFSRSDIALDSLKGDGAIMTVRMVVGDPGVSNGYTEYALNGRWFARHDGLRFRSWANRDGNRIDYALFWLFCTGGVSQNNQYVDINDIITYDPDGLETIGDTNTLGSTFTPLTAGADKYPALILPDSTYTNDSDTIQATRNYAVSPNHKLQTTQIYVSDATYIDLDFVISRWSIVRNTGYASNNGWVKIYEGIGSGKSLLQTFDNANRPDEGDHSFRVTSNSVTIEYSTGHDRSNGFEVIYTSDGTSGGPTPEPGDETEFTIPVNADARIRSGIHADINYGSYEYVVSSYNATDYDSDPFLRFLLSSVTGDSIVSATLYTHVGIGASSVTNQLYEIDDDSWIESTITWNNAPSVGDLITSQSLSTEGWYTWDVADYVRENYDVDDTVSFKINSPGTVNVLYYDSKENASGNSSYLEVVTYTDPNPTSALTSDTLNAFDTISMWSDYDTLYHIWPKILKDYSGDSAVHIDPGEFIAVYNVDFTDTAKTIIMQSIFVSSTDTIQILIDSADTYKIVGNIFPTSSPDWSTMVWGEYELDEDIIGLHKVGFRSKIVGFGIGNILFNTSEAVVTGKKQMYYEGQKYYILYNGQRYTITYEE